MSLHPAATFTFSNKLFSSTTQIDAIYFDICKAFDSVPHNQLLVKLLSCGITGKLWSWFQSYLFNCYQFVSIINHSSYLLPGVPQGSILGPPLFLIYINDIFYLNILSKLFTFADDTKCFRKVMDHLDQQVLQRDINWLFGWTLTSCLSFSPTRCIHLSFRSSIKTTYYIDQDEIPSTRLSPWPRNYHIKQPFMEKPPYSYLSKSVQKFGTHLSCIQVISPIWN